MRFRSECLTEEVMIWTIIWLVVLPLPMLSYFAEKEKQQKLINSTGTIETECNKQGGEYNLGISSNSVIHYCILEKP